MKWKIGGHESDIGAKRKTKRYAWWPTAVEGYWVFLEEYWSVEEYTIHGWQEYTKWL